LQEKKNKLESLIIVDIKVQPIIINFGQRQEIWLGNRNLGGKEATRIVIIDYQILKNTVVIFIGMSTLWNTHSQF